jgi:hypothetical protein
VVVLLHVQVIKEDVMVSTARLSNRSAWIDIALGAWLIAAPFALRLPSGRPLVVAETIVPGIFLIATSVWLLTRSTKPLLLTWAQTIGAFWLIVGSFIFIFRSLPTAALDGFVLGMLTLAVQIFGMLALTARFGSTSDAEDRG